MKEDKLGKKVKFLSPFVVASQSREGRMRAYKQVYILHGMRKNKN